MKPTSKRFCISCLICSSSSGPKFHGACFIDLLLSLILSLCITNCKSSSGIWVYVHAKTCLNSFKRLRSIYLNSIVKLVVINMSRGSSLWAAISISTCSSHWSFGLSCIIAQAYFDFHNYAVKYEMLGGLDPKEGPDLLDRHKR